MPESATEPPSKSLWERGCAAALEAIADARAKITAAPIEPPSDSLLRASLDANPGCCGNDAWRGRLCSYHAGFRDGLDTAFEWVREADGE